MDRHGDPAMAQHTFSDGFLLCNSFIDADEPESDNGVSLFGVVRPCCVKALRKLRWCLNWKVGRDPMGVFDIGHDRSLISKLE